jgi:hypothetical protein
MRMNTRNSPAQAQRPQGASCQGYARHDTSLIHSIIHDIFMRFSPTSQRREIGWRAHTLCPALFAPEPGRLKFLFSGSAPRPSNLAPH